MTSYRLAYADWSAAEYGAAAACLLRGQIARGPKPAQLAAQLAARFAPSTVYPVNYGHTALRMALDLFKARAPGRNAVLVPAYICPSVVQTVQAAGLRVVAVDVGPDLNLTPAAVATALGPDTLAVVAPHMFACPCDIGAIETLCRDAGVFLVDDAAQVVGETVGGRLLGTFGDVGLISFAQSKAVVTGVRGSGGVLLVNRPELDADARLAWDALPAPRGRLRALAYFVWNYLWHGVTGKSGYYFSRIGEKLGIAPQVSDTPARISNIEAAIALVQLRRLSALRADKIRVADLYQAALRHASLSGVDFPQYAPGRYLSRIMLSLPPGADLPALRAALARAGLETRLGYTQPVDTQQPHAHAADLARRLFGVPFRAGMQANEISTICSILSTAMAQAPAAPHIGSIKT
ncbi:MAG: DegT/DnrJ/EryC1/StrS family aminotransferase [Massilia sp.]